MSLPAEHLELPPFVGKRRRYHSVPRQHWNEPRRMLEALEINAIGEAAEILKEFEDRIDPEVLAALWIKVEAASKPPVSAKVSLTERGQLELEFGDVPDEALDAEFTQITELLEQARQLKK